VDSEVFNGRFERRLIKEYTPFSVSGITHFPTCSQILCTPSHPAVGSAMENIDGRFSAHFGCAKSFHLIPSCRSGTMMGLVELRFEAILAGKDAAESEQVQPSASLKSKEKKHGS
jgi:hypothetical protein